MAHQFTHRWGDYVMRAAGSFDSQLPDIPDSSLIDPSYLVQPRYWVAESMVRSRLRYPDDRWLLGFRNITNATNERTFIASAFPIVGLGHSSPVLLSPLGGKARSLLGALLDSFVIDYVARQKLGGTNMALFIVKQLPIVPPTRFDDECQWSTGQRTAEWFTPRILELTYTAWDIAGIAADLDWEGPPFRWNHDRRALLRAELDAAFFHLYGLARVDVDYIMNTFPIVCRNDEAEHDEYRTKRLILERYDAVTAAIGSGTAYVTPLIPGPADPSCAHDARSPQAHVGEGARAP